MRLGRASALTHTGRRRLQNEDAFVHDPPLFAIADGMGGAQAGEIASRLATAALEEWTRSRRGEEAVVELVREANRRIFRHALGDPRAAGMGTTVTAALVDEQQGTIAVAHVGDSRGYRIRDGVLEQLTADHSLVAELVRSGRLTPEEADQHPHRSVITRALGTDEDVEVDAITLAVEAGDLYLLCSDGLTNMVRDDEILELAAGEALDPEATAAALIQAANDAGGEDNITVVLFEVVEGEPDPAHAPGATTGVVEAEDAHDDPAPPVRRHGAGAGGRWLALGLIVLALVLALALIWWSLGA